MDQPAPRMKTDWLLTRADLDAATASTAKVMNDPRTSPLARWQFAVQEQAAYRAYQAQPGGDADLQAWAEEWAAQYEARTTQATPGIEAGA